MQNSVVAPLFLIFVAKIVILINYMKWCKYIFLNFVIILVSKCDLIDWIMQWKNALLSGFHVNVCMHSVWVFLMVFAVYSIIVKSHIVKTIKILSQITPINLSGAF